MPRFFFHVVSGAVETRDEEGEDCPDLEAARLEARAGIRSILREEIATGAIDLDGEVRITDQYDQFLLHVPFPTAVGMRNPKAI